MKKSTGFSMIELLITVGIIAIVMAMAAPSATSLIANDRLTTQINTFVSHLNYARNDAVTNSQSRVICASNDSATCTGSWADGWIIFADINNNGNLDAPADTIIKVQQALEGNGITFTSTAGNSVQYNNRGNPVNTGTFALCDDRRDAQVRGITLTITGNVRQGGVTTC